MSEQVPYTDDQWYAMVDKNIAAPIPLHEADLTKPFIYWRRWGVMYVPSGYHQGAMATLYAFYVGHLNYVDAGDRMNIKRYRVCETLADMFLAMPGTVLHSGVGTGYLVGHEGNLNAEEYDVFRKLKITYLD